MIARILLVSRRQTFASKLAIFRELSGSAEFPRLVLSTKAQCLTRSFVGCLVGESTLVSSRMRRDRALLFILLSFVFEIQHGAPDTNILGSFIPILLGSEGSVRRGKTRQATRDFP